MLNRKKHGRSKTNTERVKRTLGEGGNSSGLDLHELVFHISFIGTYDRCKTEYRNYANVCQMQIDFFVFDQRLNFSIKNMATYTSMMVSKMYMYLESIVTTPVKAIAVTIYTAYLMYWKVD